MRACVCVCVRLHVRLCLPGPVSLLSLYEPSSPRTLSNHYGRCCLSLASEDTPACSITRRWVNHVLSANHSGSVWANRSHRALELRTNETSTSAPFPHFWKRCVGSGHDDTYLQVCAPSTESSECAGHPGNCDQELKTRWFACAKQTSAGHRHRQSCPQRYR